jgi:hypothetical protein
VRERKALMSGRLTLVSGGIERLGVLPVLGALYLQFKGWEWGDWAAFSQVNLLGGLLFIALGLVYMAAWMAILLKARLDSMEALLSEAADVESN